NAVTPLTPELVKVSDVFIGHRKGLPNNLVYLAQLEVIKRLLGKLVCYGGCLKQSLQSSLFDTVTGDPNVHEPFLPVHDLRGFFKIAELVFALVAGVISFYRLLRDRR
ncbi:hypothetical protein MH216_21660, partial [Paenibacillus larvae]|uniref:hypothetical protein n=1 Tax=Paenibacillus larvae TaxID=1464 RepID=UPI00228219D2